MKRAALLAVALYAGCAAQATQMEACPASGCVYPKPGSPDPAPTSHLRQQAAFDLQCDQAKLAWTRIGDEKWYTDIRSWGVHGCGKQASYVLESQCRGRAEDECNWALNSPIQTTQ